MLLCAKILFFYESFFCDEYRLVTTGNAEKYDHRWIKKIELSRIPSLIGLKIWGFNCSMLS
jgi:hypothetical protein